MYASQSQRALAAELAGAGGQLRRRLAGHVHRTQLWHFARGTRRPSPDTAAAIAAATDGRVPADGWAQDAVIGQLRDLEDSTP